MKSSACLILTAFVICMSACSVPNRPEVRSDFLELHPEAEVESISIGEGDSSDAYFLIKYSEDSRVFEDEWLYQDLGDGKWRNTQRKCGAGKCNSDHPEQKRTIS